MTAMLVLGATTARTPVGGGTNRAHPHRQLVYVDLGKLCKLHPEWDALLAMKSAVADVRGGSGPGLSRPEPFPAQTIPPSEALLPAASVSRARLEAEVAGAAIEALSGLESARRDALGAALRATRGVLEEAAAVEMVGAEAEVRNDASAKLKALAERQAFDRINAQIRISALGIASSRLRDLTDPLRTGPAVGDNAAPLIVRETETSATGELAAAESELRSVQARLGKIIDVTANEEAAIRSEAQSKIRALHDATAARIEAELSQQESDGRRRIEGDIGAARTEILQELAVLGKGLDSTKKALCPRGTAARVSVARTPSPGELRYPAPGTEAIEASMSALETRVRADVAAMVRRLADKMGLRVTFDRTASGAPDKTGVFESAMCSSARDLCKPVL
jgi:hypothetical protein